MTVYTVTGQEAGQRLTKYLKRKLPDAPDSFLYRMLRKKNIVLSGKKATGSEQVKEGDEVTLYLSDETLQKFQASLKSQGLQESFSSFPKIDILYEDEDLLLVCKPQGILSQKAKAGDVSMNEWLLSHLTGKGEVTEASLQAYHPSVCNRLDRNTGGILICAKTLRGAQEATKALRERTAHKLYQMVVYGTIREPGVIEGELIKDVNTNTVSFQEIKRSETVDAASSFHTKEGRRGATADSVNRAVTRYRPLKTGIDRTGAPITLLEAELITGKTHQLRVQMASIGHPIAGDPKYGDPDWNRELQKRCRIHWQLLYCTRTQLELPKKRIDVSCAPPREFSIIFSGENGISGRAEAKPAKMGRQERDKQS